MAQQTTQTPAETQAPAIPGRLEGIEIDSCTFTESVSKREPRPPLFVGKGDRTKRLYHAVCLKVPGGKVVVRGFLPHEIPMFDRAPELGEFIPIPPRGPAYTGPITPAMWSRIRKYWHP